MRDLNRRDLIVGGSLVAASAATLAAAGIGTAAQASESVPSSPSDLKREVAQTAFFDGVSRAGDPATTSSPSSGNGFY